MTSMTTLEVESYFDGVRAALSDLPADVRDELLEELPDHLAEVAAEEDGSLVDRLGRPEDYAAELRAAAGIEPLAVESDRNYLAEWWIACDRRAREFNGRGARWLGYDRISDLARALRPGWWVLRGWLIALLFLHRPNGSSLRAVLFPRAGGSIVLGLAIMVGFMLASIWFGTRSTRLPRLARWAATAAGAILLVWFVTAFAARATFIEYSSDSSNYSSPLDSVQDVYVYDQSGNPVPNARLYDQNGNPIQLGTGYCPDGTVGPYVNSETNAWTYPICPAATGPFRAGPGAVSDGPPAASSTPPAAPTTTAPKPSVTPKPTR